MTCTEDCTVCCTVYNVASEPAPVHKHWCINDLYRGLYSLLHGVRRGFRTPSTSTYTLVLPQVSPDTSLLQLLESPSANEQRQPQTRFLQNVPKRILNRNRSLGDQTQALRHTPPSRGTTGSTRKEKYGSTQSKLHKHKAAMFQNTAG